MTYKKQSGRKTSAKSNQPKKPFHKPTSVSKSSGRFERSDRPTGTSDRPAMSEKAGKPERYAKFDQPMGRPAGKPARPLFKKSGKSLESELLKKIFHELKNTSKLSDATIKQVLGYFEPPARGKKPARKSKFAPVASRTSLNPTEDAAKKPARKSKFAPVAGRTSFNPTEDAAKKPARPPYKGTAFKKAAPKPTGKKTAAKPGLKRKTR